MGITAQSVPKFHRESKYQFTDADVKATADMLAKGQNPGEGGYESEGTARSAGQALVNLLDDADVGIRVFEGDDGWHFALKRGKKHYKPRAKK